MRLQTAAVSALLAVSMQASAGPGGFVGVSYTFGGGLGLSLKALSTNEEGKGALAAGVSYYPMTGKWGIDAGAGYLFRSGAGTMTWDFLRGGPQIGVGYVNTRNVDDENARLIQFLQQRRTVVAPPPPVFN